jgi:hypothetical protein
MTSTNQASSGRVANLVSSSPELLTRPASKPGDRSISSTGELRTAAQAHAVSPSFPFACFVYFVVKQVPKLNVAPRSACSAYPFEKNLALSLQPSAFVLHLSSQSRYVATSPCRSEPLVVRFAEILLRFAETSQQTLRHFLLLPTTCINFAEKIALKSKLLRLLRPDPKLHCHFVPFVSTFRSADSPVRPFSSFQRTLNIAVSLGHNAATAKNTFRTRKNTRRNTLKTLKNTQNTEKNTFFFYEPRNVNSRSACSAYLSEKIRNRMAVCKDSEIINAHESPVYRPLSEIIRFETSSIFDSVSHYLQPLQIIEVRRF